VQQPELLVDRQQELVRLADGLRQTVLAAVLLAILSSAHASRTGP
jgi:hypothetical protein